MYKTGFQNNQFESACRSRIHQDLTASEAIGFTYRVRSCKPLLEQGSLPFILLKTIHPNFPENCLFFTTNCRDPRPGASQPVATADPNSPLFHRSTAASTIAIQDFSKVHRPAVRQPGYLLPATEAVGDNERKRACGPHRGEQPVQGDSL